MARHRTTLIAFASALTLAVAASAQTLDTSATNTSTSSTSTGTMQPIAGKNLLWLSSPTATCPTGYTQTTVNTSSGPKKACVANTTQTTSNTTVQTTSTDSVPQ